MQFPTTQTLETFLEEQVAAYQLRLDSLAETPRWVYSLHCSSEFNDSYTVDLIPISRVNEGRDHLYHANFQFTGSAACELERMELRVAAMQQAMEYFKVLVEKLNSLGGWVPCLED